MYLPLISISWSYLRWWLTALAQINSNSRNNSVFFLFLMCLSRCVCSKRHGLCRTGGKCFKASRWNNGVTDVNSHINKRSIPDKPVRTRSWGRAVFIDLFEGSPSHSTANRLPSSQETWLAFQISLGKLACCAMHLPIKGGVRGESMNVTFPKDVKLVSTFLKDCWLALSKLTSYSQLLWNTCKLHSCHRFRKNTNCQSF